MVIVTSAPAASSERAAQKPIFVRPPVTIARRPVRSAVSVRAAKFFAAHGSHSA